MKVRKKKIFPAKFSKPSRTIVVQILGINKQCNNESINIFSIKIYQTLSVFFKQTKLDVAAIWKKKCLADFTIHLYKHFKVRS